MDTLFKIIALGFKIILRLGNKIKSSIFQSLNSLFSTLLCNCADNYNSLFNMILLQLLQQFKSVHLRHINVKNNRTIQIRIRYNHIKAFKSVFCNRSNLILITFIYYIRYNPSHECRVIYYKNFFCHSTFPSLSASSAFVVQRHI